MRVDGWALEASATACTGGSGTVTESPRNKTRAPLVRGNHQARGMRRGYASARREVGDERVELGRRSRETIGYGCVLQVKRGRSFTPSRIAGNEPDKPPGTPTTNKVAVSRCRRCTTSIAVHSKKYLIHYPTSVEDQNYMMHHQKAVARQISTNSNAALCLY